MATYVWCYDNLPVSAQIAGEYMKELEQKHSALTPQIILEESRPNDAVLHNCFEWDDEKAAEGFRLHQARHIIRNISVKIETVDKPPQVVRAFVNVRDESRKENGSYISVDTAMQNTEYKNQVLQNVLYEFLTTKNKYAKYTEVADFFADVFKAIDETANRYKNLQVG